MYGATEEIWEGPYRALGADSFTLRQQGRDIWDYSEAEQKVASLRKEGIRQDWGEGTAHKSCEREDQVLTSQEHRGTCLWNQSDAQAKRKGTRYRFWWLHTQVLERLTHQGGVICADRDNHLLGGHWFEARHLGGRMPFGKLHHNQNDSEKQEGDFVAGA